MKDYQAPVTKKPRISGFNFWQINWQGKDDLKFNISLGLHIKDPNAQQMCANS